MDKCLAHLLGKGASGQVIPAGRLCSLFIPCLKISQDSGRVFLHDQLCSLIALTLGKNDLWVA